MGDSHTSAGHCAVCEWRWVIKTRLVQGCSWQPHQNFHYPPVTSADCFSFGLADWKPKYILFYCHARWRGLENCCICRKWNCVWRLTSDSAGAARFPLINRLTVSHSVWCLIWKCQFWRAWHLVPMTFRAVFHLVVTEETNSDVFNMENNIELSAILILCLLIIKTLNMPVCTILTALFFSFRNLVNRGLLCINICIYVHVYIHTVHLYI